MRIIIVRHGDPNYELDTLTKTGWRGGACSRIPGKTADKGILCITIGTGTGYRRMYFEKNEPDGRDIRLAS